MHPVHVWIRVESRGTERRAPVVPADIPVLVDAGFRVTVEESPQRIFAVEEYAAAGASVVGEGRLDRCTRRRLRARGSRSSLIEPESLRHRHVYFAHAFKGQEDAQRTLERFRRGGSAADIEFLIGEDGSRVVAFGYWAGYVGAALGVLHLAGTLAAPLVPMTKHELDAEVEQAGKAGADELLALVTGARGRSGRGAQGGTDNRRDAGDLMGS